MPNKDLIPSTDSLFDTFMTAFYQSILANLINWGILKTDVDPATPFLVNWKTSYGVCRIAKAATSIQKNQKNTDRSILTTFTRKFIQKHVYLNDNMDDKAIIACGLIPHNKEKKHAGKPTSIPVYAFTNTPAFSFKGTYHQEIGADGTSKRGKPTGVGKFQVSIFVGAVAPVEPKSYTRSELFTKTPFLIAFEPTQAGQLVWLIARWVSTDNIPGNWGKAISMTIY